MVPSIKKYQKTCVTIDGTFPNVYYLDRDAKPVLIQINPDQYELRQGRRLLGIVAFRNGSTRWGWCFTPHISGKRPSRKLHPNPEAALRGRFVVSEVYPLRSTDLAQD